MAQSESSGPTSIVAICAMVLMLAIVAFLAWHSGALSGRAGRHDVQINTPAK